MDTDAIVEGVDPMLGTQAGASLLAARFLLFPLVTLRRQSPADEPDQRTGRHFIPKPLQKAVVFAVLSVINGAAALVAGKPPVMAVSAGAVGALGAMAIFDAQFKRAGDDG